jgi:hypothetical protein
MSARALVLGLFVASACASAHRRASASASDYADEPLSPRTKVMLVAGGDDVANFAAEVVEQRRMWRAAGLSDDEIACYWAPPTPRAKRRDRRQYKALAAALTDCRPASAARVLADIAEVGGRAPPWFYLYITTHGVQALGTEESGWYLDADEREFLDQHALSLDADPALRLQHVGNILEARRSGVPDDELVMTPAALRRALEWFPEDSEKIVVLQGCFSGGFISDPVALGDLANTTVLTAAASNRPSFGCGSGTRTTFWGGALDRELRKRVHLGVTPPEVDWRAVHDAVSRRVTKLERRLGQRPSRPQFDP